MSEETDVDLITEKQVKKATFLIHKLASRRGADFKDIQKKCKQRLGYTNLAKVTLEEGHAIIDKLLEWTGGEEEKKEEGEELKDDLSPQLPIKPDDGSKNIGATITDDGTTAKEIVEPDEKEVEESREGEDSVITIMRQSVRAAVKITQKEVVDKEIPVMGLGGFVLEIAKVIFEAKRNEEAV